jgi:hypothetical protein
MAMTNAERQKKYRDRKRGSPPVGRWPKEHLPVEIVAKVSHVGRTSVFMASWVGKHAPECQLDLAEGRAKMTPLYRRLRREYLAGIAAALEKATAKQRALEGWTLTERHKDGHFVFEWVRMGE